VAKILCFLFPFRGITNRGRRSDELRWILSGPRIAEVIEITFCFRVYQENEH
jgi:hypothetical protein